MACGRWPPRLGPLSLGMSRATHTSAPVSAALRRLEAARRVITAMDIAGSAASAAAAAAAGPAAFPQQAPAAKRPRAASPRAPAQASGYAAASPAPAAWADGHRAPRGRDAVPDPAAGSFRHSEAPEHVGRYAGQSQPHQPPTPRASWDKAPPHARMPAPAPAPAPASGAAGAAVSAAAAQVADRLQEHAPAWMRRPRDRGHSLPEPPPPAPATAPAARTAQSAGQAAAAASPAITGGPRQGDDHRRWPAAGRGDDSTWGQAPGRDGGGGSGSGLPSHGRGTSWADGRDGHQIQQQQPHHHHHHQQQQQQQQAWGASGGHAGQHQRSAYDSSSGYGRGSRW